MLPLSKAGVDQAPALGKTVGRGMAWMVAGSVISKGASVVTFGAVAALVSREDVGVWTMAFSFAAFTQFLRDGGVPQVLIQRGAKEYETLAGPVFWLALLVNLATGGLLAALAPVAAGPHVYNEPRLLPLLLIMALQLPLMSAATVWWARLQIDLRYDRLSNITTVSAVGRAVATVVFAWLGYGPLSFVLPIPMVILWENIAYAVSVREWPWKRPARVDLWRGLLATSINAVMVTFAFAVVNQGPYFALGRFLTSEQLGVFSLGYQIVTLVDQLLAATGVQVLFSALSKLNEEPERQRAATLRAARLMTLMSSLGSFGVFATVGPLALLIWGEKWVDSILPAMILAAAFPWRVLLWVPSPALQAQGRFRASAIIVTIAGAALTTAAVLGAVYGNGDAVPIAVAMAAVMVTVFLGLALRGLSLVGVPAINVLAATVPSWVLAALAGLGAWGGQWLVWRAFERSSLHPRLVAAVAVVVAGGMFCVLAYALFRLLARGLLREVAELAPARLGFVKRFV